MLAIALVYVLQVIDANVFSYMHNFEVSNDLALKMEPIVGIPDFQLAFGGPSSNNIALGVRLGLSF